MAIVSSSLFSHQRSESYSKIVIDKNQEISDIQIEFSLQTQVLQRLESGYSIDWEREFTKEILEGFVFNESCRLNSKPFLKNSSSTGYITLLWKLECALEEITINFDLFFNKDTSHTHIATFLINSVHAPEKVFSTSYKNWKESDGAIDKASDFDSLTDYFNLGF